MVDLQDYNSPEWNAAWENFLEHQALDKKLSKKLKSIFLTRLKRDNWDLKIDDVWEQTLVVSRQAFDRNFSKIYDAYEDECPELGQGSGNFPILRDYLLNMFSPKIAPDNKREQYRRILQPGALIRIKAPNKMGKTRLLNNFLAFAYQQEYQTVHIEFLQLESNSFQSLELFLYCFCTAISDALNLKIDLQQYFQKGRDSMQSCTRFLKHVLQTSEQAIVLGLDDLDRLLKHPNISQDFFYLLRVWHEKANYKELWQNLRLIVVYSTEDFGNLNINKSPFNVGEVIELTLFNHQQIKELAQQYRLDLSDAEIEQLSTLLGGHPYLVDLMISHLINNPQVNLKTLLEQAPTDIGIYQSFLRELLINLRDNHQLAKVFSEIINSQIPIQIDTLIAYQLYSMGLIKWSDSGKTVMPLCELYRLYFQERLSFGISEQ